MKTLTLILRSEIRLALHQIGDSAIIVLFFVLAAVLFPLGIGPEPKLLPQLAPGVIWIMALLAAMLLLQYSGSLWLLKALLQCYSQQATALSYRAGQMHLTPSSCMRQAPACGWSRACRNA